MKITNEVLEGYLNCKTKGHLKLTGQSGTPSDYEAMTATARATSREAAIAKLVAFIGEGDACRGVAITAAKSIATAGLVCKVQPPLFCQ